MHTLHDNTVRWLAGIVGELQRDIARLEKENAGLRERLREAEHTELKVAKASGKAKAAGAGSGGSEK